MNDFTVYHLKWEQCQSSHWDILLPSSHFTRRTWAVRKCSCSVCNKLYAISKVLCDSGADLQKLLFHAELSTKLFSYKNRALTDAFWGPVYLSQAGNQWSAKANQWNQQSSSKHVRVHSQWWGILLKEFFTEWWMTVNLQKLLGARRGADVVGSMLSMARLRFTSESPFS